MSGEESEAQFLAGMQHLLNKCDLDAFWVKASPVDLRRLLALAGRAVEAEADLAAANRRYAEAVRALAALRQQYLREASAASRLTNALTDGEILDADEVLATSEAQAALREKGEGE